MSLPLRLFLLRYRTLQSVSPCLFFEGGSLMNRTNLLVVSFLFVVCLGCGDGGLAKLNELVAKVSALTTERDQFSRDNIELQKKLDESKKVVNNLSARVDWFEAQLRQKTAESAVATQAVAGLKERKDELKLAVSELTTKKGELELEIARRDEKKRLEDAATAKVMEDKLKLEQGIVPLELLSKDGDARQRRIFILCVAQSHNEKAYKLLVNMLADNDVADTAMNALSRDLDPRNLGVGKASVKVILGAIKSPATIPASSDAKKLADVKARAMRAIVNIGYEAVDDLILLFVEEKETREWARDCLVQIGSPSKPSLQRAMVSSNELIKTRAFEAFQWIETNETSKPKVSIPAPEPSPAPVVNISVTVPETKVVVNNIPTPVAQSVVKKVAPSPCGSCN